MSDNATIIVGETAQSGQDDLIIGLDSSLSDETKIKVVGVGGGGCNAVNNMVNRGLTGVELIAVNTDLQALKACATPHQIQIGKETTGGKGAGSNPEKGKISAQENIEELRAALKDSDMVVVTCGMGGGTGTGAAPVIAQLAQEMGALVVGIVTLPFSWEGQERLKYANDGIAELRKYIDSLIVIPNEKLKSMSDKAIKFKQAFKEVDDVLYRSTSGIAEIIVNYGYMNVDFADVKTVLKGQGDALMGVGRAKGENRAVEAVENALNSPFFEDISIKGARQALINIVVSEDLAMQEITDVFDKFREYTGDGVTIKQGVMFDNDLGDELQVTILATGFHRKVAETEKTNDNLAEVSKTQKAMTFQDFIDSRDDMDRQSDRGFQTRTDISHLKKPVGNEQLKDLDPPAFIRRSKKFKNDEVSPIQSIISTAEKVNSKYESERLKTNKKEVNTKEEHNDLAMENIREGHPAFLRKIMD